MFGVVCIEISNRVLGFAIFTGVLMDTEIRFPSVGAALIQTFFPGKLRDHEQAFWSARAESATKARKNNDSKRSAVDQSFLSLSHNIFQRFHLHLHRLRGGKPINNALVDQ